jgi:hypothetical protein
MSISKIKYAAKSLKTFQGVHFEECLDNGVIAEQLNKWLIEVCIFLTYSYYKN